MKGLLALSLVAFSVSVFAVQQEQKTTTTPPSGEQIRQMRIQQEADQIINPAPMQTMHSDKKQSVEGGSYPPMTDQAYVQAAKPKKVTKTPAAKKTAKPKAKTVKKLTPAETYYDALLICKPGLYRFKNPLGQGDISNAITGRKTGYCQVKIHFTGETMSQQCLFSPKVLKALSTKKAKAEFAKTYATNSNLPAEPSLYDKSLSQVCLLVSK